MNTMPFPSVFTLVRNNKFTAIDSRRVDGVKRVKVVSKVKTQQSSQHRNFANCPCQFRRHAVAITNQPVHGFLNKSSLRADLLHLKTDKHSEDSM